MLGCVICSCIACVFLFTCIHVHTHVCIIIHLFKVTALSVQASVIMCVHIWPWHLIMCTHVFLGIWGPNRYLSIYIYMHMPEG